MGEREIREFLLYLGLEKKLRTASRKMHVAGNSTVSFLGTSLGIVGASEGIVTSGDEVQGVRASVSLGVGISPIDLGTQSCNATVTRIWRELRTDNPPRRAREGRGG